MDTVPGTPDWSERELVGRLARPELERLAQTLGRSPDGGVVLVSGPVGTGKTRLTELLAERMAVTRQVIRVSCPARGRREPYDLVQQVVSAAGLDLEELCTGGDLAGQPGRHGLDRLARALITSARARPLLITVTGVQFADPQSLQCLAILADRMRGEPVHLVLVHTGPAATLPPELFGVVPLERIPLERPMPPTVRALAVSWWGEATGTELAGSLTASTGGNVLLLAALAQDYALCLARARPPTAGPAFAQAVAEQLQRCDQIVARAAEAVAVLGPDGTPALLSRLLKSMYQPVPLRSVGLLDDTGLSAGGRLREPAAASTILAGGEPRQIRTLHRAAAGLLHREGAPIGTVVGHLLRDDEEGPDPWAASLLRQAAHQHMAEDRVEEAVSCLEQAVRHSSAGPGHTDLIAELTVARWRLDPVAGARHAAALIEALRDEELSARQTNVVVRYLLWHGRFTEAAGWMARLARAGRPEVPDPEAADELCLTREWAFCAVPGWDEHEEPDRPPADGSGGTRLPLSVVPRLQAVTALRRVLTQGAERGMAAAVAETAEHVLYITRLEDCTLEQIESAVLGLIYADRLEKAEIWCAQLLAEAERRRARWWQVRLAALGALTATRRGRPEAARRLAATALEVPDECWGVAVGVPLAALMTATVQLGDLDQAAEVVNRPVPGTMFRTRYGLHYLHARGLFFLAGGHPHAALGDFRACETLMRRWNFDVPAVVPWRSEAAWALLQLGDETQAAALATQQLQRVPDRESRSYAVSLRALAAAGPPRQRIALLRNAIEVFSGAGDPFEAERAREELAEARYELEPGGGTREKFRRARQASSCSRRPYRPGRRAAETSPADGYEVPRTRAADPADPVTATPEDLVADRAGDLSEAERRVAQLAAQGNSNREIALLQGITVSTVEQHLTRVYRKLDISQRADLPLALQLKVEARTR